MSSLVIDVTQLARWQGKLTGIPRVMNELSARFAAEDYILAEWDGANQVFRTVEFEVMTVKRQAPLSAPAQTSGGKSLKGAIRSTASRSKLARRVHGAVRRPVANNQASSQAVIEPAKGDTLIILWGSWDDQQYIDRLVNLDEAGVELVQFAYDMLPLVTPQFSGHSTESLGNYVRTVYPRCRLLLAISRYTARDVKTWLKESGLTVPPVEVVRLGEDFFSDKDKARASASKNLGPAAIASLKDEDFLLCVSTIEARKNHALLYYVYKLAMCRGIRLPKLVIVGRLGWLGNDIFTLMSSDPETKDSFVFLQDADDAELSWLYERCLFTIYPSFYEGWGLPIAESLAHGKPCLSSNTSSMPEIAGDLISYFSPFSSDECLKAIIPLLSSAGLAKARAKVKKYQPTTWDETYLSVKLYIKERT